MTARLHAEGKDPGKGERLVPQGRTGVTKEGKVLGRCPGEVGGLVNQSTFYLKKPPLFSLFFREPTLGFSREVTKTTMICKHQCVALFIIWIPFGDYRKQPGTDYRGTNTMQNV